MVKYTVDKLHISSQFLIEKYVCLSRRAPYALLLGTKKDAAVGKLSYKVISTD